MSKTPEQLAAELIKWENNAASVEQQIAKKTASLTEKRNFYVEQASKVRESIRIAMENNDIPEWENDVVRFKYIKASVRRSIDLDQLKKNRPQIYARYLRKTPVKASVRITVK